MKNRFIEWCAMHIATLASIAFFLLFVAFGFLSVGTVSEVKEPFTYKNLIDAAFTIGAIQIIAYYAGKESE